MRKSSGAGSIFSAVENNDIEQVQKLLRRASHADPQDSVGRSPLWFAAKNGNVEIVELLLTLGAFPDTPDASNQTPLFIAAERGHVKVCELLIASGASVDFPAENDMTPLMVATKAGHLQVVIELVEAGAHIEQENFHGQTAVTLSLAHDHSIVAKYLQFQKELLRSFSSRGKMWAPPASTSAVGNSPRARRSPPSGSGFSFVNTNNNSTRLSGSDGSKTPPGTTPPRERIGGSFRSDAPSSLNNVNNTSTIYATSKTQQGQLWMQQQQQGATTPTSASSKPQQQQKQFLLQRLFSGSPSQGHSPTSPISTTSSSSTTPTTPAQIDTTYGSSNSIHSSTTSNSTRPESPATPLAGVPILGKVFAFAAATPNTTNNTQTNSNDTTRRNKPEEPQRWTTLPTEIAHTHNNNPTATISPRSAPPSPPPATGGPQPPQVVVGPSAAAPTKNEHTQCTSSASGSSDNVANHENHAGDNPDGQSSTDNINESSQPGPPSTSTTTASTTAPTTTLQPVTTTRQQNNQHHARDSISSVVSQSSSNGGCAASLALRSDAPTAPPPSAIIAAAMQQQDTTATTTSTTTTPPPKTLPTSPNGGATPQQRQSQGGAHQQGSPSNAPQAPPTTPPGNHVDVQQQQADLPPPSSAAATSSSSSSSSSSTSASCGISAEQQSHSSTGSSSSLRTMPDNQQTQQQQQQLASVTVTPPPTTRHQPHAAESAEEATAGGNNKSVDDDWLVVTGTTSPEAVTPVKPKPSIFGKFPECIIMELIGFVEQAQLTTCFMINKHWCSVASANRYLIAYLQNDVHRLYQRLALLDKGATGTVHRYIRRSDGRVVAIKKVPFTDAVELAELQEEMAITRYACSPNSRHLGAENVVRYIDSHRLQDELWIVMEYMSAGKLTDLIKACQRAHKLPLPEALIAYICREVLKGLQFLHESKHIIHRDVKSDNVLLHHTGATKLADFGLSKALTVTEPKRNTATGTPFWMAPEVIQTEMYDYKADVWSVGILIIEMCRGDPPYMRMPVVQALVEIVRSSPPVLGKNEASEALRSFTSKCLQKKPKQRATVNELLQHRFLRSACDARTVATALKSMKRPK
eukprot:TRINITY_DN66208_c9_g2_i1.p1 TRINITY_DN66208_c9_g2~~TRINITY_DN66208_c9_g2_i1.p1  ORF type:complete len:1089 (+),score=147.64 TRINITY_DN66208_c9_g2_i1:43-3309(+)